MPHRLGEACAALSLTMRVAAPPYGRDLFLFEDNPCWFWELRSCARANGTDGGSAHGPLLIRSPLSGSD